jgi:hypothetical protein
MSFDMSVVRYVRDGSDSIPAEAFDAVFGPYLPAVDRPSWDEVTAAAELNWKTRSLIEVAAGRTFVWIDDEITDTDRAWVVAHHPVRTCSTRSSPTAASPPPTSTPSTGGCERSRVARLR